MRGVKMHEFLAAGGIQTGYVAGKMTYSKPIDPAVTPVCPWHETTDCEAWTEIREGRGTGSAVGPHGLTLPEIRERTPEQFAAAKPVKPVAPTTVRERVVALGEIAPDEIQIEGDAD